jgi:hypothetical protein
MVFNLIGGSDFTSADALTIALACVALILAFFAVAKGCEKFMNNRSSTRKNREGMAESTYVDPVNTNRTAAQGQIVTSANNSTSAVTPIGGTVSLPSKRDVGPADAATAAFEIFGGATDASCSLDPRFGPAGDVLNRERMANNQSLTSVISQFANREGMTNVAGWPSTAMNSQRGYNVSNREGMSGCTSAGGAGCYNREHMDTVEEKKERKQTVFTFGADGECIRSGDDTNANACNLIVPPNPYGLDAAYPPTGGFIPAMAGLGRERFEDNVGFLKKVDNVQYQCMPVASSAETKRTGNKLSYLRVVPQCPEQALSAELPFGLNELNQGELTATNASQWDIGQMLLRFGPDEVTTSNVAITGEDGFIARELKYRRRPVVLTDGVNTYTLNKYADWVNFKYNPNSSTAVANASTPSAMEAAIETLIPNSRVQLTGTSNDFENIYGEGLVTNSRNRSGRQNRY